MWSDQSRIIKHAKGTLNYFNLNTKFSFRKSFWKTNKTIESQGKKQVKALEEHVKKLVKPNVLIEKYDDDNKKDSPEFFKTNRNI